MKKLKIGYFADGPWSHAAFEKIIKDENISVEFIVPRSDTSDEKLREYANRYSLPYFKLDNINSSESLEKIKSFNCDLLVSMSFNQIFRKETLNLTPLGVINCHAGKLPYYRGRNVLNWALINDESEFGITVHYIDEGIDTGDIILQRSFEITDEDTYQTLLKVAYNECANILYDSLKLFYSTNKVERIPQSTIHEVGLYCGRRGVGDEIIDWNQNSRRIFNFVRSISEPGPIATSYLEGKEVKINKAIIVENAPEYIGTPGQILSKTEKGFLVKTLDTFIEIFVQNEVKIVVGKKFKNG